MFLGASYFRAVGKDHVYGLSARGLAVDTASPSGEEFPYFREFWLVRPAPNARSMVALRAARQPAPHRRLPLRGVPGRRRRGSTSRRASSSASRSRSSASRRSPACSSTARTPRCPSRTSDPRSTTPTACCSTPSSGEWLWRPLDNRRRLELSSFDLPDPKGFGLIQRDRDFDHYQDLEARYDLRPSAWVEPQGAWGAGASSWSRSRPTTRSTTTSPRTGCPAQPAAPGTPATLRLRRSTGTATSRSRPPGGRVEATRLDREGRRLALRDRLHRQGAGGAPAGDRAPGRRHDRLRLGRRRRAASGSSWRRTP